MELRPRSAGVVLRPKSCLAGVAGVTAVRGGSLWPGGVMSCAEAEALAMTARRAASGQTPFRDGTARTRRRMKTPAKLIRLLILTVLGPDGSTGLCVIQNETGVRRRW